MNQVYLCHLLDILVWYKFFLGAFSALGFTLSMLTKGTPTAFSALGFQLSMLTYALTWTFFAVVAILCFPMRTPLALWLLFGRRLHVCRFTSRSFHDCSQGEWGLDPVDWTGTGALVLVLWRTRGLVLLASQFQK